jgi:hypothetical protein
VRRQTTRKLGGYAAQQGELRAGADLQDNPPEKQALRKEGEKGGRRGGGGGDLPAYACTQHGRGHGALRSGGLGVRVAKGNGTWDTYLQGAVAEGGGGAAGAERAAAGC